MKEELPVAVTKIHLLLLGVIEMGRFAGNYWFKTGNPNFLCASDPFGSLVQLWDTWPK
jgi:hypothetical protein